ncbi:myo-inositol 2-dehydrogenase/D-chiro-inositol 1-dehydrogenase [Microcella alkaliphila]|uniref:Myo-inositol 2-dehydrogenase/D-chiro-inositol 1-dehydrogenase n=1 Tax=Microcella alkaliphila TaxID=279828 RepID=A0A4Q7U0S7_9MICO|nr:inositol 2-dehydrogenase [Microcella alkaliphila]RZT66477.1 myo-inositol 2-dehydrogenase/D-chiro-inositol 1-dehydrogenase [Microcella alkaliphila]
MSSPLRIGLIGTGRIGQVHARSVASIDDAELTWVCDPFEQGARSLAARFGGQVTTDSAEVFAADDVDAVIIASPTSTHVSLIDAAINAGVPALCEKPIDLDIGKVDGLRQRANESTVPFALGFNRRFDPHFAAVHRRVLAGEIGRLEQLTITSRDPAPQAKEYVASSGGIFRDMTIHDLDMARFFVPDIVEVTARGANQFDEGARELGDYDAVQLVLRGSHDELISITNSRHSAYGYDQRLEAFGDRGLLQVGNVGPDVVRAFTGQTVEAVGPYFNFFVERYVDAYRLELIEFLKAVRGENSTSPSFEDGRAALVLANAAEEAARTGASVKVDVHA